MAHTAPPPGPHRRLERSLGILLLLVGATVLVIAVLALNHPKGRQAANASQTQSADATTVTAAPTTAKKSVAPKTTARTTPAASPTMTPSSAPATVGKLPLVVLNNTSQTSSSTAAARFERGGWTVTSTGTFMGGILSTAAYYDPNVPGAQAAALALQQQFPAIHRVKAKFDGLPSGPIVVVLTSDYS